MCVENAEQFTFELANNISLYSVTVYDDGLMYNELNNTISSDEFPKNLSSKGASATSKPHKSMIKNITFISNRCHEETKKGQKLTNSFLLIENHQPERRQHPESCKSEQDEVIESRQETQVEMADWVSIYYQDVLPLKHVSPQEVLRQYSLTRPSVQPTVSMRMCEPLDPLLKNATPFSAQQMLIKQPEHIYQNPSRYYSQYVECKSIYVYDITSSPKHVYQQEVKNTPLLPSKESNTCNRAFESLDSLSKTVHTCLEQQRSIRSPEGHELCVYQHLSSSRQSWAERVVQQRKEITGDYLTINIVQQTFQKQEVPTQHTTSPGSIQRNWDMAAENAEFRVIISGEVEIITGQHFNKWTAFIGCIISIQLHSY